MALCNIKGIDCPYKIKSEFAPVPCIGTQEQCDSMVKIRNEEKQQVSTKQNNLSNTLLGVVASNQVNELIEKGWEFTLHYGDHENCCDIQESSWEADFTRRNDNGLWDNHECGYGNSPDVAIENSYNNIKNGIRLKK